MGKTINDTIKILNLKIVDTKCIRDKNEKKIRMKLKKKVTKENDKKCEQSSHLENITESI